MHLSLVKDFDKLSVLHPWDMEYTSFIIFLTPLFAAGPGQGDGWDVQAGRQEQGRGAGAGGVQGGDGGAPRHWQDLEGEDPWLPPGHHVSDLWEEKRTWLWLWHKIIWWSATPLTGRNPVSKNQLLGFQWNYEREGLFDLNVKKVETETNVKKFTTELSKC